LLSSFQNRENDPDPRLARFPGYATAFPSEFYTNGSFTGKETEMSSGTELWYNVIGQT